jgi:hypothetical protein
MIWWFWLFLSFWLRVDFGWFMKRAHFAKFTSPWTLNSLRRWRSAALGWKMLTKLFNTFQHSWTWNHMTHDNMTPLKLSQTREILSSRSARCLPLWSIGTGGTSGTVVPCKSQWDWQENLWDFMKTEHLVSNGDSVQWSNNIELKCCLPVHAMLRELFTRKGMLQVHL